MIATLSEQKSDPILLLPLKPSRTNGLRDLAKVKANFSNLF